MAMKPAEILHYLRDRYEGLRVEAGDWEGTALYYNPDGTRTKGYYCAWIKEADTAKDRVSHLGDGRYRFGLIVSPDEYRRRFGTPAKTKGGVIQDDRFDFTASDIVQPYPTYNWKAIAVINPSAATFEALKPLINDAYALCKRKYLEVEQRTLKRP